MTQNDALKHVILRRLVGFLRDEQFEPIKEPTGVLDAVATNWTVYYPHPFLLRLERAWGLKQATIVRKMVVPMPSFVANRLITRELRKFWPELPHEFSERGLRVDKQMFPFGALVPVLDHKKLITGLRVYRTATDKENFVL